MLIAAALQGGILKGNVLWQAEVPSIATATPVWLHQMLQPDKHARAWIYILTAKMYPSDDLLEPSGPTWSLKTEKTAAIAHPGLCRAVLLCALYALYNCSHLKILMWERQTAAGDTNPHASSRQRWAHLYAAAQSEFY